MVIVIIIVIIIAIALIITIISSGKKEPANNAQAQQQPKTYNRVYLLRLAEVKRQAEARGDEATVAAVLNMTYDGPLPTKKQDNTFTDLRSQIISYDIAGINFRRGLRNYVGSFMGYLKPEPTNKFDENAIAIYHSEGKHLGYIHADRTDEIRALNLQFPIPIWGEIEEDYDFDENRRYYRGEIYIELPPKVYPQNS